MLRFIFGPMKRALSTTAIIPLKTKKTTRFKRDLRHPSMIKNQIRSEPKQSRDRYKTSSKKQTKIMRNNSRKKS